MKIACEKCGTSYEVEASRIPSSGLTMKCTVCFNSFTVAPASEPKPPSISVLSLGDPPAPPMPSEPETATSLEDDALAATDAAQQRYLRDRDGNVFGPFPLHTVLSMLQQGKLDGDEEASLNNRTWVALDEDPELSALLIHLQRAPEGGARSVPPPLDTADLEGLPPLGGGPSADVDNLPAPVRVSPSSAIVPPPLPTSAPSPSRSPLPELSLDPSAASDAPEFADLPTPVTPSASGLPQLAGLPPLPQPRDSLVDLPAPVRGPQPPGPPVPKAKDPTPGSDDGGLDLPGLLGSALVPPPAVAPPPAGGQGFDMSGFELSASPGNQHVADAAELPMPKGLDGPPGPGVIDLPAPKGEIDLPTPVGGIDLPAPIAQPSKAPASEIDLPTPSQNIDLPRPSPNVDLPTPLSAPSGLSYGDVSLPEEETLGLDVDEIPVATSQQAAESGIQRPGGGIDLPGGDIDLSGGIDLPGGTIDLPGDKGQVGAGALVDLPGGTIDLPQPVVEEGLPPSSPAGAVAGSGDEVKAIPAVVAEGSVPLERTGRLPSRTASKRHASAKRRSLKPFIVGGTAIGLVILIGVALGLVTDYGFFGSKLLMGEASPAKGQTFERLKSGRELLAQDTYGAYAEAAKRFESIESEVGVNAEALRVQALSAIVVRFGPDPATLNAAQEIDGRIETDDEVPIEVAKARGLLQLARSPNSKDAVAVLKTISEREPQDALAAVYLGWAQMGAGEAQPAKAAFQHALAAQPKLPGALFGLAQLSAASGNSEAALDWADKTMEANPRHVGAILFKARTLMRAKKLGQADAALKHAMALRDTMSKSEEAAAVTLVASTAMAKGHINEARKQYQKALELDPASAAAHLGMGKLLKRANQYRKASEHFKEALRFDPSDVEVGLLLARSELALGKPLEARNALEALLKRAPQNPRVLFALGTVEESVDAIDSAINYFNRAIKLDNAYFEPYLHLSRLYLKQKKTSAAFATLKQARTFIRDARVINALGEAHYAVGDLRKAREKFELALSTDENFSAALFNLANTLRDEGRLDKALEHYERLQRRDQDYPQLAANVGRLYAKLGRTKEAAASYHRALKADSPSEALRLDAGYAFVKAGEFKTALEQADAVIEDNPATGRASALRAAARLGLGEYGEALVEIGHALKREASADYYLIQARIYEALHKPMSAVDSYSEALRVDPKRLDIRFHRARLLVRAGTVKDGLKELRAVLKVDPSLAEAYLYKGLAYADMGEERQAVTAYQEALKRDRTLGEAHLRLAQIYADRQQLGPAYTQATAALHNAGKGTPWLAEAHYLFGQLAMKRNLKDEAVKSFKAFLKLAPPQDAGRRVAERALAQLGAH